MDRLKYLVVVLLIAATPAVALHGTVVDPEGAPILGARVCYMMAGVEGLCSGTDENGFFDMPDGPVDRVRVSAPGYLSQLLAAVNPSAPITLQLASELKVVLKTESDGSGIGGAEVFLIMPSGRRIGPFPTREKGVIIRSLDPGVYRVLGRAAGFVQQRAVSVTLEPGKKATVDVPMAAPAPAVEDVSPGT